ncbi:MAG: ATP-binding cassette domain-containing protein [Planctomycetes bacterium]|nr:ATP-binding cassette domain-containing protein [Planctomycetota bacterium]
MTGEPVAAALAPPAIEARALTLSIGTHVLLHSASFDVRRGELVLLCGPSGAGKTVLLKLLAGVLRAGTGALTADGELRFEATDLLAQPPPPGRVGVLFQNHALFDELSPEENVLFALRHRAPPRAGAAAAGTSSASTPPTDRERAHALLSELGVAGIGKLRHLSGGQLQRVALARTLALDPDLLLYDEPTTGLDPANAKNVAAMIQSAHAARPRTTVIVTHDLAAFRGIAREVLWLAPEERALLRLPLDRAVERAETRHRTEKPAADEALPFWIIRFLAKSGEALEAFATALLRLLPTWPRARYGVRYLLHYLRIAASPGAFLYVGAAGLLLGFVATYFAFEKMPKRGFIEPLFVDDVLSALGFMMFRVLAPLLVTLLIAARTGAAFAADIGGKVYARQFDALRSFGVDPSRYLLTALSWSLLLAMPLLVWTMWWTAEISSLGVFLWSHPERNAFYWERAFTRGLVNEDFPLHWGWDWVVAKTEVCALGIAAAAWFIGSREKLAADDVSRSVTRTVIGASLWVLFVHFLFAFVEFKSNNTT